MVGWRNGEVDRGKNKEIRGVDRDRGTRWVDRRRDEREIKGKIAEMRGVDRK